MRATRHGGDWIRSASPAEGIEVMAAYFGGRAFAPHQHDTYAIGVTERGVQGFDYRGRSDVSLPGEVVILHPDELHDGRAVEAVSDPVAVPCPSCPIP